ncbi:hypothetical protein C7N43_39280, partial [Sphingobacteriales bacterium UPWRP_1]
MTTTTTQTTSLWQRFWAVLLLLAVTCTLFAQAPNRINYQAIARNASGQALTNQNVAVRISVRQNTAGGAVQYQERHTATTNAQGLFNLQIGGGTALLGNFTDVTWSDGLPKFLQTELDPAGGTAYINMGTQQLASVPYAQYANEAGSCPSQWAMAGNDMYNNNLGTVSIGTAAPAQQSSLYVTGAANAVWADADGGYTAITGSGINGSVGVNGSSDTGSGIAGSSNSGAGVNGFSVSGTGVNALTSNGNALHTNSFTSGNETWLSTNDAAILSKGRLDFSNSNLSTTSHFYFGPSEHIYLRSGTAGSFITLNDTHNGNIYLADGGGRVSINNGTFLETGVLTVRGNGSANSTADFYPTSGNYNAAFNAPSSFNYRLNDGTGRFYSTFIRGGQTGSRVYLNDVHNGDVIAATGGGNMGIGTLSPDMRLHVSGQTKLKHSNTDGTYADAVLTIETPVGGFAPSIAFVPQDAPTNGLVLQGYAQSGYLRNYNNTGYASLFCFDVVELSDARCKKMIEPIAQNQYSQYLQALRKIETIDYLFENETLNKQNPDFGKQERANKRIGFTAQSLPDAVQQTVPKNHQKPDEGS